MSVDASPITDRSWLVPSCILTTALGAAALTLMPNYSVVLPALGLLPLWLFVCAALGSFYALGRMIAAGIPSPISHIIATVRTDWRGLLLFGVGITLAGLNMIAFMWAKPLLNYFVPFWADPLLARFDRALFLGHDPSSLLSWLNTIPMAIFYHRAWFAMMIVTLMVVLSRPPSPTKSAVMLTYFLLWSVAGPAIHVLLPAAGPVFFERLGYGSNFAGIPLPDEMVKMVDYLWRCYTTGRFGAGSGISAMPSLHIATTVWMVLAIHALARRWTWAMAAPALLIFLLSMSLGWHYAADGVVGGLVTIAIFRLCLRFYEGRLGMARATTSAPALVDA